MAGTSVALGAEVCSLCGPLWGRCGGADADANVDSGSKSVEHGDQTISGESGEVGVTDAGEVRGGETGSDLGSADCELVAIEKLDDRGGEERFQLLDISVFVAKIAEGIATSAY